MAYTNLINAISAVVKTNGNGEITGQNMQDVLKSIVNTIGANATFAGIATPATVPPSTATNANVFYIASQNGTYSNFGGIVIADEVAILSNMSGSWAKITANLPQLTKIQQLVGSVRAEYLVEGALNEDGNIFYSAPWYTYHKVPIKAGQTINYTISIIPTDVRARTYAIYDADGTLIESGRNLSLFKTFENDGYVSVTYNNLNSWSLTIPDYDIIKKLDEQVTGLQKLDDIINIVSIAQYETPGALNVDGEVAVVFGSAWHTWHKIPVKKGDVIYTRNAILPTLEAYTGCVIFNTDNEVIHTIKNSNVTYTITEDGFVSLCNAYPKADTTILQVRQIKTIQGTFDDINIHLSNVDNALIGLIPRNISWVAIGDSITAGNNSNTGTSYATFAQAMLGNQVTLHKLGYWGHTAKASLATLAYNAMPTAPKIITMNFGYNDVNVLGETQWGDLDEIFAKSRNDLQDNVSTFESMRLFVEKCRENKPSALIYFVTPIGGGHALMSQFIELEKQFCAKYAIPLINANEESGIRKGDTIYLADGIHPNDLGKMLYARYLVTKIAFLNLN